MKVCIVGFGAIAEVHAEHLSHVDNARLYAVCDVQKERADKAAEKYGLVAYYDYDTCLEDDIIECVHICTPHYLHYEMIEKALNKGKYVVCEKPVVMTKKEFCKLNELSGTDRLCIVMQNRLNPCVIKMKEIISSGSQGSIVALKGFVTWMRPNEYYESAFWRGRWDTEGGGVLINQSVHTLDLMCYLTGEVRDVKCAMANFALPAIEVEDSCMARLEFQNGAVGVFFATNSYGENSSVELEVSLQKCKMRYIDGKLYVNGELAEEDARTVIGKTYWGMAHRKIFEKFYNDGICFGIDDVKNTMKTMFSMYDGFKTH